MATGQPNLGDRASRRLELELACVRAEAKAAQLEARAAEIEMLLLGQVAPSSQSVRPSLANESAASLTKRRVDAAEQLIGAIRRLVASESIADGASALDRIEDAAADTTPTVDAEKSVAVERVLGASQLAGRSLESGVGRRDRFGGNEQLRRLCALDDQIESAGEQAGAPTPSASVQDGPSDCTEDHSRSATLGRGVAPHTESGKPEAVGRGTDAVGKGTDAVGKSTDAVGKGTDAVGKGADAVERTATQSAGSTARSPSSAAPPAAGRAGADSKGSGGAARDISARVPAKRDRAQHHQRNAPVVAVEALVVDEHVAEGKRRRPAAWLASTLAHAAVLLLLALFTLSNPGPRDQLALSASATDAAEEVIEAIKIETFEEIPEEPNEPSEALVDVDPLGELPAVDVSVDLPAEAAPLGTDLLAEARDVATPMSRSEGAATVQFAGIEGGGNHFVYLVDSSNSMRNFNEARLELLRSIAALESTQRFYVVFYDQAPDYMRLSDPNRNESKSVYATDDNKAALRRWAMTIEQERGKSPIDVLRFAFTLRPDVIFLLSDGEFSKRTEVVIRELNQIENLFGDQQLVSIIHTIRYPGYSKAEARNAEIQMRRIASENGGQYRNVEIN